MSARALAIVTVVPLLTLATVAFVVKRKEPAAINRESREPRSVELSAQKQQTIWDVEHIAFEIERRFGVAFLAALRSGDAETLASFFAADCITSWPVAPGSIRRRVSVVSETRQICKPLDRDTSDTASFVASIIEPIGRLGQIDRAGLRALKVCAEPSDPRRWKAELLLTARGFNSDGGIASFESKHDVLFEFNGESPIDVEGVVAKWSVRSTTWREAPQLLMEEATESFELNELQLSDNWKLPVEKNNLYQFQMAVEDFDRDGFLDIAIASGQLAPVLLRSIKGRRFVEVTTEMGLRRWESPSILVAWIDYDNDGYPDLLMGNQLYHNVAGQRFEAVAHQGTPEIAYDPMGAVVADYDCDGLADLYVLYQDETGDSSKVPWVGDKTSGMLNQLWHNEGDGVFKNVTVDAGAGGGHRLTFAASWFFLDDDRFPDLYIANDFGENVLLRNTGTGLFADVTKQLGAGDFATSMGVATGDINNDGSAEIYVANMYSKMGRRIIDHVCEEDYPRGVYEQILGSCAGNRLYTRAAGESSYREISNDLGVNAVGWAYAPAFADFDNNGWLDLYATTGYLSFDRGKPDG